MSKFSHKFFAGFCMGIAEITPGISGATIAGLFNVYKDFVNFLNIFNPFKIKPNLNYFYYLSWDNEKRYSYSNNKGH